MTLTVVGVGCDGIAGLSPRALRTLTTAQRIIGSPRQLELVSDLSGPELKPWPKGFWKDWAATLSEIDPDTDVILGSGDPMFHGIGTSLVRELGRGAVETIPAPSSASLACAYLGWALDKTAVVSLVTGEIGQVVACADHGHAFLVLCRDANSVLDVAHTLQHRPGTKLTAMTNLGGPAGTKFEQSVSEGSVEKPPMAGDLTVLAVEPTGPARPWLADGDFDTDGQMTKSPLRELTVSALEPRAEALLWDIGGGTGSIGVEWARHGGRVISVEHKPDRVARIQRNAAALSGRLRVVTGLAPAALDDLPGPQPDAIFIGGGLTTPGMIDTCFNLLAVGGVLVANTVTIESEQLLWDAQQRYGGTIHRLSVERAHKVGNFTSWKAAYPVVQWKVKKEATI